MNRGSTRMNRGSTGIKRGQPGLHRESNIMFNTSGRHREGPATTDAAPRITDSTGNNRDGTVAPPGPIQTPAELRQTPVEPR
ncbi:hypothetical protein DPMN_130436 [Dreissena polymorpha]|uniref:Uncharacterized protein n=1 Tax=Dreissena polymorpha TaxID=45954 RepID=A0A9D4H6R5_DREPO|nr:hypothetical protein DPMN_130436 [Dreissena polymorpha]